MADLSTGDGVDVRRNSAALQYEAWSGEALAGRLEYGLTERDIVFTHTGVEERFQGRGIGSTLIRQALDDVRARGERTVVARCAMVRAWIERHQDYQDLLRGAEQDPVADQGSSADQGASVGQGSSVGHSSSVVGQGSAGA